MASNDPGFAVMPTAEDPKKGGAEGDGIPSDEQPIAPDQFDPQYETSIWEIWAYYAYYIGNNGLTLFNFAPTAFQNLLSQAAGDAGTLQFAGVDRNINSIVLVSNGISFAIQIVLFLIIGSYAGNSESMFQRMQPILMFVRLWSLTPQYTHRTLDLRLRYRIWMDGGTYGKQVARCDWTIHCGL